MVKALKFLVALSLLSAPGVVTAQSQVFVYPQKGQTKDQQDRDEYECWKWAKEQSGVDPAAAPAGPDRGKRLGGTVGGAAKGAAAGALIGAIAGDAGKGAAIGAGVGGIKGRSGAVQNEKGAAASQTDSYNRAFGVCMEGRGYSVK
jgi:hypothetical protein